MAKVWHGRRVAAGVAIAAIGAAGAAIVVTSPSPGGNAAQSRAKRLVSSSSTNGTDDGSASAAPGAVVSSSDSADVASSGDVDDHRSARLGADEADTGPGHVTASGQSQSPTDVPGRAGSRGRTSQNARTSAGGKSPNDAHSPQRDHQDDTDSRSPNTDEHDLTENKPAGRDTTNQNGSSESASMTTKVRQQFSDLAPGQTARGVLRRIVVQEPAADKTTSPSSERHEHVHGHHHEHGHEHEDSHGHADSHEHGASHVHGRTHSNDAAGDKSSGPAHHHSGGHVTWVDTGVNQHRVDSASVNKVPSGSEVLIEGTAGHAGARLLATTAPPPTAPATTERSITVVLAKLHHPDAPTSHEATSEGAATPDQVRQVMQVVDDYWAEQTSGKIRFDKVRVVADVQLTARCENPDDMWQKIAQTVGFREGPRQHLMVHVADEPGCPLGLAEVRSTDAGGMSFVQGTFKPSVAGHELGHNLGLAHSNMLKCGDVSDRIKLSTCFLWEYADRSDIMGFSRDALGSLSAPHRTLLGVDSNRFRTITGPAEFTLAAPERADQKAFATVRVPGLPDYFLEYRPTTWWNTWLTAGGLQNGNAVQVRRWSQEPIPGTLILDATPSEKTTDENVGLSVGQTMSFGGGRLQLTLTAADDNQASVRLIVDGKTPPKSSLTRLPAAQPTATLPVSSKRVGERLVPSGKVSEVSTGWKSSHHSTTNDDK